jgi:hypothetical protein
MHVEAAATGLSGPCVMLGNSDMYGLGIRTGFYMTWSAGILAGFMGVPEEVVALRVTLLTFTGATLVALVVQTIQSKLSQADIYITLLMCFGYYYLWLLSVLFVVVSTSMDRDWKPPRLTIVEPSAAYVDLQILMLFAVSAYQLWFWIAGVHRLPTGMPDGCHAYGFAFAKVSLTGAAIRGLNLALVPLMASIASASAVNRWNYARKKKKEK